MQSETICFSTLKFVRNHFQTHPALHVRTLCPKSPVADETQFVKTQGSATSAFAVTPVAG